MSTTPKIEIPCPCCGDGRDHRAVFCRVCRGRGKVRHGVLPAEIERCQAEPKSGIAPFPEGANAAVGGDEERRRLLTAAMAETEGSGYNDWFSRLTADGRYPGHVGQGDCCPGCYGMGRADQMIADGPHWRRGFIWGVAAGMALVWAIRILAWWWR